MNTDQSSEKEIFTSSGIYQITKDSLDPEAVHIHLSPMKIRHRDDGPGIILGVITLGQAPVLYRDVYIFSYAEIQTSKDAPKSYDINIGKRYWFWDVFSFNKHFNQKAGQAFAVAYREQKHLVGPDVSK